MNPVDSTAESSPNAIRVLVVDDDPDVVELMVGLLEDEGFSTLQAHLGEEALEIVRRERPELVLLDVVLPDVNGREICARIKESPDLHDVFVILISGHEITREKRIKGLESGADEYLSKPVQIAELVARIHSFVRIHEARQALKQANEKLEARVLDRTRELRRLSRRLIETQELERRRIARELHDEAGQAMTVLKFVFNELEDLLPDEGMERLEDGHRSLNRLVTLIRNLYQEIRPSILDDLGLLPALLWQFDRYTLNTKVRVSFEHEGIDGRRFSPDLETAAYRVAQESLTNIARHAGVEEAYVRVWANRGHLHIRVDDRGRGFEPSQRRDQNEGCGVLGMSERVQLLGGCFEITSQPQEGTSVSADFPLQPTDAKLFQQLSSGQE